MRTGLKDHAEGGDRKKRDRKRPGTTGTLSGKLSPNMKGNARVQGLHTLTGKGRKKNRRMQEKKLKRKIYRNYDTSGISIRIKKA